MFGLFKKKRKPKVEEAFGDDISYAFKLDIIDDLIIEVENNGTEIFENPVPILERYKERALKEGSVFHFMSFIPTVEKTMYQVMEATGKDILDILEAYRNELIHYSAFESFKKENA